MSRVCPKTLFYVMEPLLIIVVLLLMTRGPQIYHQGLWERSSALKSLYSHFRHLGLDTMQGTVPASKSEPEKETLKPSLSSLCITKQRPSGSFLHHLFRKHAEDQRR